MTKFSFESTAKWLPGLTLFAVGLIYLSYLPVNYDFDGTVFSQYLRYALVKNDPATAIQPQHPLYIPVNYLLYGGLQKTLGYPVSEYFHLQLFSLCFGLLALWVTHKILRRITAPDRYFLAIAGMLLAAFAYGPWFYSVEAEVHMPGLFFITAGMYLLFFKPGDPDKLPRTLGAALCFVLAAGFHLSNGLIAVSALLIFLLEKKPFLKIARFFLFYGLFLLLELALIAPAGRLNLLDFYKKELLGMDAHAGYTISYWTAFSAGSLWNSLGSVAHGILVPASPFISFLSISFLLAGAGLIILAGVKSKNRDYYKLAAWMLPYFVFFTAWDHGNMEFKLNVIYPFIILLAASAAFFMGRMQSKTAVSLAGGGILMIILSIPAINFHFYMEPAGHLENNRNYGVAEAVARVTPPQAVIVVAGCGDELSIHAKINISYFALRKVFILDWMLGKGMTLEAILARLDLEKKNGTPVYFFSDTLREGPALRQLWENHHLQAGDYSRFLAKLALQEKIPLIDGYYLQAAR